MTGIKLVALDVDGVLRESSKLFYECHKKAMEIEGLGEEFERCFEVKDLWHFKGLGKFSDKKDALNAIYVLAKAGKLGKLRKLIYMPDAEKQISLLIKSGAGRADKATLDRMVDEYHRVARSPASKGLVRLYPGVKNTVEGIKRDGKLLAIFTNSSLITLERDLDQMLKHFDYVITPNEVKAAKPSGEGLLLISKRSGVSIRDMMYVGDTVVDIKAAKDAHCKCIAVRSGMGLKQHLEREEPDYIFKDLKEASKFIIKG